MCGIAGFIDGRACIATDETANRVRRMTDAIAHRGPDDSGIWIDAQAGVALGHRRLSVIDLSPNGHQPMASVNGRYTITYNGEVYNFQELRAELEGLGHQFRGGSDTEVMLAAFLAWGVRGAVERFVGMFAFAVWDRDTQRLQLVRDRLGVKPLYWSLNGGTLLFGSELKALMAHPTWQGQIDPEATAAFVRYSYIPGTATIFSGVQKLAPGSIMTYEAGGDPRFERYWTLHDKIGSNHKFLGNESEAADRLDALLRDAVRQRMIADVPLGAFLSGGIDSSIVVAMMQAQSSRKVRTFTIGFHESGYNEAKHAKAVAEHLGTDHTELYISPDDMLSTIARLPDWFDEPFADSSQIPTFLVAQMTRAHVTVALSGDGGDELFAGYPRYRLAQSMWRKLAFTPKIVRQSIGGMIQSLPESLLDRFSRAIPSARRPLNFGRKMHRLASLLHLPADDALHAELAAAWPYERRLLPGTKGALSLRPEPGLAALLPDFLSRMQYYDSITYLPDDILVKVDRCTMAVALEARGPLLDHRVIEFAWSLPPAFKMRNGESKWLLRRVLDRYVPRSLVERPKMGFSVPLGRWLRGPLHDWARALLEPARIASEGIFCCEEVENIWQEHQTGSANRETVLWNLLMFQTWRERYRAALH
jgi:asparagine synthase (glutamine-hydrolysing)